MNFRSVGELKGYTLNVMYSRTTFKPEFNFVYNRYPGEKSAHHLCPLLESSNYSSDCRV